jgi:excisionase family DNA binding protein
MAAPNAPPNPIPFGAGTTTTPAKHDPAVMTTDEVARYLGINKKSLDRMRGRGDGPPYVRLTGKLIRYRKADIDDFIESRVRSNTAQA